jgi:hypothetical protein
MTPRNQIIIDNRWVEGEIKKYRSNQEQLEQNQREKEAQRRTDERVQNEARDDSQRATTEGQV